MNENIDHEIKESSPDIKLVDAKDFPWLDLNYYDRIASEFQLEGFALIGDIEFVCFSEILPRGFRRTMCSRDGIIVAEIFHEKVRGLDLVLRLLFGRLSLSCKGVYLTTEFSDGSFAYTVTGKNREKSNPLPLGMTKQYVAPTTPIRDMIEIHKSKAKEHIKQNPDNNALALRTFQQWAESLNRVKLYSKHIPEERDTINE
jgi:hypothetical protein